MRLLVPMSGRRTKDWVLLLVPLVISFIYIISLPLVLANPGFSRGYVPPAVKTTVFVAGGGLALVVAAVTMVVLLVRLGAVPALAGRANQGVVVLCSPTASIYGGRPCQSFSAGDIEMQLLIRGGGPMYPAGVSHVLFVQGRTRFRIVVPWSLDERSLAPLVSWFGECNLNAHVTASGR